MTPEEYESNALRKLDIGAEELYKKILKNIQDQLSNNSSRSMPSHLELTALRATDDIYSEDVLTIACRRLIKHYQSLGWVVKITKSSDPFKIYETPQHVLYLTYTKSNLVKFWYSISGDY